MLQRKSSKPGKTLGKTTGWIHRRTLQLAGVKTLSGVNYNEITKEGIWVQMEGEKKLLEADHIIVCAGQFSQNKLFDEIKENGLSGHIIGGALEAGELDAKRAIDQGTRLAISL